MDQLVFLRHGHALGTREAGVCCDSERPLSPRGEEEALAAARRLLASGFRPDVIVASPFLRAARTADLAASVFPAARRETSPALSEGPAQAVLDLAESTAAGSVLIVGHQPLLGAIAGFCLGAAPLDLSPAGFVRLRRGGPRAKEALLELYDPASLKEQPR
ncbi:MAG: histidine phosphatase family protein [Elusimicrobiales bacterium]|nr:histidine phosphatase family protein [Elusimicrobiales bacterium]